jgi:adenylate cyclase
VAEDRLALLPVERALGGRYTAAQVEDLTGLPAESMIRYQRLLGLPAASPEEAAFRDEDIEAARSLRLFLDAGFDPDQIAQITRVLGEAMARLAAATTAAFASSFLRAGDSELDVARRFSELTARLAPAIAPVLMAAYRAQLHDGLRRAMLSSGERRSGVLATDQELAVGFADLVGFTSLGGEIEAEELAGVAGQFAQLATEVARPPVRLVKTIGDGAMLVSRDVEPLVQAALSLVASCEAADLPALRAGVAWGTAGLSAGDVYGHAVNLASRVTGIARPGSVLCTQEVHDAAPDAFDWSFARRHRLKGIGDAVPLYRARKRTADR